MGGGYYARRATALSVLVDLLKYFADEPTALYAAEAPASGDLTPLDALLGGPQYYRGYVAGTHLPDDGEALRIGATALDEPGLWIAPLLTLFPGCVWTRLDEGGRLRSVSDPSSTLREPHGVSVLVAAEADGHDLAPLAAPDRREAVPALCALLDTGAVVFFPEPAHDGFDWSVFAATPLRDRFVEALLRHPSPNARRFVLPYAQARGEHRFYFEQWQLDALPDFVTEV